MRLDSVRELKHSLPQLLAERFALAPHRAFVRVSPAVARAASTISTIPSYALGIAPGRKNEFRLAVRIQNRALEGTDLVKTIREAAANEVDIRYIGRVVAWSPRRRSQTKPWHQSRQRPLRIGSSCGYVVPAYHMAGTIGCFVGRVSSDRVMILSNSHVLADEGRYPLGNPVVQPGTLDGGDPLNDRVASLTSYVRFRKKPASNYVDAAVSALDDGVEHDTQTMTGLGHLAGLIQAPLDPEDRVHKVGRTTGARHGKVTAIEVDGVDVEYDIGVLRFDNQVEIEGQGALSFSEAGDSGSLVVDDNRLAAALLFAGSDQGGTNGKGLTYANPIGTVLGRMKLKLLY